VSRRHLLLLALLALSVRLGYNALFLSDYLPLSDAHHYDTLARSVAAGEGVASPFPFGDEPRPTAFRPPLYPLFLGAVYAVVGAGIGVAQIVNVLLGTVVVLLVAVVASRLSTPRVGIAAGIMAAISPPLLANDGPPLAESLGLCLMLAVVLLLIDGRTSAAGVVSGLLVLTKPSAQAMVVVLLAFLVWRVGWRRAAAFGLAVALVVTPWLVRNWQVLGAPVLATSNGFNLAALYSPQSRAAGHWLDPLNDPRFDETVSSVAPGDEAALDSALRQLAVEQLRREPFAVVDVSVRHVAQLFDLRPPEGDGGELLDGRNLPFRYATLPLVWLLLAAGLAGMWVSRRSPGMWALLVVVVPLIAVAIPFSPMPPRLRAPLDVAVCIGAALFLRAAYRSATGRVSGGPSAEVPLPEGGAPALR
jgi:4-amino-4-deoxy-L-arabinose transferase-like glycosyltransferase